VNKVRVLGYNDLPSIPSLVRRGAAFQQEADQPLAEDGGGRNNDNIEIYEVIIFN
jgi:hypothetical protein